MFAKPNEAVIRQLARLSTQEFEQLTSFLEEELAIIDSTTRRAVGDEAIHRLQGRGLMVEEFLSLIRKAPEMRDKKPYTT